MKWLKIKKYLKIFSVIICSILIFNNKIYALENKTNIQFNYSEFEEILNNSDEKYRKAITELINYLKKYENDYYINLSFNPSLDSSGVLNDLTSIFFRLVPKTEYFQTNIGINVATKSIAIGNSNSNSYGDSVIVSSQSLYYNSSYAFFFDYDFETYISGLDEKIENTNFSLGYNNSILFSFSKNSENIYEMKNINPIYIYSNFDFNFFSNDYNLIIDEKKISNGDKIISYYDYYENTKEPELNYRMQFNNDVSPDLKQITFDFPKAAIIDFNLKSKIEIGNWSLISEELPVYLSQKIIGYDSNQIEYDMNDYFNIKIDTTDYLTTKELNFSYSLVQEIPDNIIRFKIYYDFDIPVNNYFFNVFDNFIEGTTFWNYIENFLVGYNKYEFPDGYDLAIIRSKNFNDLESFFISDKLYFTSPEYDFNLKLYDFNNKIEKYNFNSLTQYLFNPVYLKIPIKIDETNNIFPVLTKHMNNESGIFYLKDDLFVQFINSENLDSIIDGIPEDQFNDNNDLNIGSDIGNLNPPQQDEESLTVFFNEFWKIFEKFSNILSYITSCFAEFFYTLPTTIQIFLCVTFAFIILKMLVFFIL